MNFRKLIPSNIKLKFQHLKRFFSDLKYRSKNGFASDKTSSVQFPFQITTIQEIKKSTLFENKVHNIKTASARIEPVLILPNEIFSFWKTIGAPNKKNNFKKGRNIVNGQLFEEIGGGLCQLSGIVYLTALKGGVEIIERYNHSIDIYKEEERFTPLGSDATVVYGYKDLRIRNNYPFPIRFSFSLEEDQIICKLSSPNKIKENKLQFERTDKEKTIEVVTLINSVFYGTSIYKK